MFAKFLIVTFGKTYIYHVTFLVAIGTSLMSDLILITIFVSKELFNVDDYACFIITNRPMLHSI